MVQSIWLSFDETQLNEATVKRIIDIIKDRYKTVAFDSEKMSNVTEFHFLDCHQIKDIQTKLKLKVDDSKRCDYGCFSTDFEKLMWYISLEFFHGKIHPGINQPSFSLGRIVTCSVGLHRERLNVLRYILMELSQEFISQGIICQLDLSDCELDYFTEYDTWQAERDKLGFISSDKKSDKTHHRIGN